MKKLLILILILLVALPALAKKDKPPKLETKKTEQVIVWSPQQAAIASTIVGPGVVPPPMQQDGFWQDLKQEYMNLFRMIYVYAGPSPCGGEYYSGEWGWYTAGEN